MYSQLCLPHSIVIYCTQFLKVLHRFQRYMSWFIQVITRGHTGWKYHWEERGCCWNCWACPVSVVCVLSYSGLGLLSSHSLWGPSTETVVGFRVCTFLFRTWSMLPSSLRTKYWRFFFLCRYFHIQDSVCPTLFEDQVPNFSRRGKTQPWTSSFICLQV